ncbi:MAG TPA: hypothetical protein V6D03_11690 [Candidatus Caenarcaniphilales bacterium]
MLEINVAWCWQKSLAAELLIASTPVQAEIQDQAALIFTAYDVDKAYQQVSATYLRNSDGNLLDLYQFLI